jgi:hypothetical protein
MSPNGVAPNIAELSKERAKTKVAEANADEQTWGQWFGEIDEGIANWVGGGIADEDMDPKLKDPWHDQLGWGGIATVPAVAALGYYDTLKNRDERTGNQSGLTSFLGSALNVLSIGQLKEAEATVDMLYEQIPQDVKDDKDIAMLNYVNMAETGEDFMSMEEREQQVAMELQASRDANPWTAFTGDVVASIATGAALGKTAFSLANSSVVPAALSKALVGNPVSRLVFGSSIGGAEMAAYSWNMNGDLNKALIDGSVAALGGLAIGGLFNAGKTLFGKEAADAMQARVGNDIIEKMNFDNKARGLPPVTASQVAEQFSAAPAGSTMLDIWPGLQGHANRIVRAGEDGALKLAELIHKRQSLYVDLADPQGPLRKLMSSTSIVTQDGMLGLAKKQKAFISPKYTELYKAADDAGVTFSGKKLLAGLREMYGPQNKWLPEIKEAYDFAVHEINSLKRLAASGVKGKKTVDLLTAEQTNSLYRKLGKAATGETIKKSGKDAAVASTNELGYQIGRAKHAIGALIQKQLPELGELNFQWSDLEAVKPSFKAGIKGFKEPTGQDFARFLANPDVGLFAKRAYVMGAKNYVFGLLKNAKTEHAIRNILESNKVVVEGMEAMYGKEQTQEMIGAVLDQIKKLRVTEQLEAAAMTGATPQFLDNVSGKKAKELSDIGIALASTFGGTSQAAGLGAFGRTLARPISAAAETAADAFGADLFTKMGNNASDAFGALSHLLEKTAVPSKAGGVINPAIAGSITGVINDNRFVSRDAYGRPLPSPTE